MEVGEWSIAGPIETIGGRLTTLALVNPLGGRYGDRWSSKTWIKRLPRNGLHCDLLS